MTPEERAARALGPVRTDYAGLVEDVTAAIRAAVAEEREACARMVDAFFNTKISDPHHPDSDTYDGYYYAAEERNLDPLAAAIRARG